MCNGIPLLPYPPTGRCHHCPSHRQVASKYSTVETLRQQYMFVPAKYKDCYLAFLLTGGWVGGWDGMGLGQGACGRSCTGTPTAGDSGMLTVLPTQQPRPCSAHTDSVAALSLAELAGSTSIIFTRTCDSTRKIALTLRNLGFGAVPIHGQMSQPKRLAALNKFKAGCGRCTWLMGGTGGGWLRLLLHCRYHASGRREEAVAPSCTRPASPPPAAPQAGDRNILIATDVASRGLDIPSVSEGSAGREASRPWLQGRTWPRLKHSPQRPAANVVPMGFLWSHLADPRLPAPPPPPLPGRWMW